ncbi:hypothetical protein BOTBODRAFT_47140 [Botryobasidium botryosum FD-172 SS1]|uniref:Uncharacterized protein n=1 Tax=Botryobasidium botryosum (strain FD-172 SS1) TaxID=930990 RepID=A0A067MEI8_BOTB1|nr:hypothetical protein BOTBODRAFT_47140 [Botryobasidium botryosum FD-172 SS1]
MAAAAVPAAIIARSVARDSDELRKDDEKPVSPAQRRRYPTHLSKSSRPHTPSVRQRGTSKTYESLEELLTAAGYRETRIFTPESERVEAAAAAAVSDDRRASLTERVGIGRLLSGWIPGSTPPKQGKDEPSPEVASEPSRNNYDRLLPSSPLAHRTRTASPLSRTRTRSQNQDQETIRPSRTITPASKFHDASATPLHRQLYKTASSASLRMGNTTRSSAPRPARTSLLRHAASTPHFREHLQAEKSAVAAKQARSRPVSHDGWLSAFVRGVFGATSQPQASANDHPSPDSPQSRGRSAQAKRAVTNPSRLAHPSQSRGLPAAPIIKHESVICRSTPASRSSSVVRGNASRNAPLLSPAELDLDIPVPVPHRGDCTLMWTLEQRMRRQLSQSLDPEDENDDPNLERILSSYISAQSPSPSSKAHSLSHTSSDAASTTSDTSLPTVSTHLTSASTSSDVDGDDTTSQRSRSIHSLRKHLTPRPARPKSPIAAMVQSATATLRAVSSSGNRNLTYDQNPIVVVATPRTAERGLPGRAVWVDGPEWDEGIRTGVDSVVGSRRKARKAIPQFPSGAMPPSTPMRR